MIRDADQLYVDQIWLCKSTLYEAYDFFGTYCYILSNEWDLMLPAEISGLIERSMCAIFYLGRGDC